MWTSAIFAQEPAPAPRADAPALGGIGVVLLFLAVVLLWPLYVALSELGKRKLSDVAQAVWALTIVAVPILGWLAFFIVKPQPTASTPTAKVKTA